MTNILLHLSNLYYLVYKNVWCCRDYLLSIRGLGLKSVECVRLLTLHQLAFPVKLIQIIHIIYKLNRATKIASLRILFLYLYKGGHKRWSNCCEIRMGPSPTTTRVTSVASPGTVSSIRQVINTKFFIPKNT